MADDRNGFVILILCISQDIWAAVKWVGVEIGKGYYKRLEVGKGRDNMALYDINPIFSIDMDSLSAI